MGGLVRLYGFAISIKMRNTGKLASQHGDAIGV